MVLYLEGLRIVTMGIPYHMMAAINVKFIAVLDVLLVLSHNARNVKLDGNW